MSIDVYKINYSGDDIDSAIANALNISIIKFYSPAGILNNADPIAVFVGAPGTYIKWEKIDFSSYPGYTEFKEVGVSDDTVFSASVPYLISGNSSLVAKTSL